MGVDARRRLPAHGDRLRRAPYVQDVGVGDLWYFPTGVPYSLQGLGPNGCEFLLVFDDGAFSEDNTTLISDWAIHTPREGLAKNWRAARDALEPLNNVPPEGRYIFQTALPGPLDDDRRSASQSRSPTTTAFDFRMMQMAPQKSGPTGAIRIPDSTNFPVAANIAMAHVTLKPGGLRELHWHPNADEWQYYISGKARMTLFTTRATPAPPTSTPAMSATCRKRSATISRTRATKTSSSSKCSGRLVIMIFR